MFANGCNMNSRVALICCFLFALWTFCVPVRAADVPSAAVEAARAWLGLVDAGEYGHSWQEAAVYFRNAIPKEKWIKALNGVRLPLGELVSRKLKTAVYATSLPGAPDGEYVVIQFDTVFANKQTAIETVTPMKDPDGAWRASGYFIK